jgi:hypothetical protein
VLRSGAIFDSNFCTVNSGSKAVALQESFFELGSCKMCKTGTKLYAVAATLNCRLTDVFLRLVRYIVLVNYHSM